MVISLPANAEETASVSTIALSDYKQAIVFQKFQKSGYTRGDRGAENPNRFETFMVLFEGFTPASQEFILRAFDTGQLTKVEEGKDLYFENGKLAANLIRMTADIEIMARYIETRVIPEDQQIPRASDNFDRMIRNFPDVASVLTYDVQSRIIALEKQVIVVLNETLEENRQVTAGLRTKNEALDRQIEQGLKLNDRLDALLNALQD